MSTDIIEHIREKLLSDLPATNVEIIDDSWKHAGHAGARPGNMHLTIHVASEKFQGQTLIDQHRMVHQVLKEEIGNMIHALILKTCTPDKWPCA